MDRPVDVIVCGHLCLDLLPQMEHIRLNDLPSPGRLFEVGSLAVSTGGAVSNTGLALHRLGVNVRLMSNVGDDLIGRAIRAFLESRDPALGQSIRIKNDQASSYTIVLSPERADRIFLHCTGTNAAFASVDVDYDLVGQAKIFHLGYPPLLPSLIADDGVDLERLFRLAHEAGAVTSLDTTLPDSGGVTGQADWSKILARTLPYVDIFVPSIKEIIFMLRRADYERWQSDLMTHISVSYLDDLADQLFALGVSALTGFKLGEYGIYLCGSKSVALDDLPIVAAEWLNRRVWHPAFAVKVAGTTGAGDAAYAGLLAALLNGLSVDEAARWACAVGACCVEAPDATSGVRTWAATSQRLNVGWKLLPQHLNGF